MCKNKPLAIGSYSQGIEFSNLIFVSGQLPVNSVTWEIPNSIEEQAKQSLENIMAVLKKEGFYPARSCVEVARLSQDAQIEVIAVKG